MVLEIYFPDEEVPIKEGYVSMKLPLVINYFIEMDKETGGVTVTRIYFPAKNKKWASHVPLIREKCYSYQLRNFNNNTYITSKEKQILDLGKKVIREEIILVTLLNDNNINNNKYVLFPNGNIIKHKDKKTLLEYPFTTKNVNLVIKNTGEVVYKNLDGEYYLSPDNVILI